MADKLTTEQLLLLNNLMYSTKDKPLENIANTDAKTVGEFVDKIDTSALDGNKDYGSYITGDDWNNIITAIKNDPQLMNLQIAKTHKATEEEGGGGGVSALFVDPSTNEAIVTFRGTAADEWKDNFVGGGPTDAEDGVSTPYQENALEWYQTLDLSKYGTVTITGHSKGGNKAKYITILDKENTIDRCVSFDGQGFSDEFYEKYQDEISANQGKITNHNVEGDFVNILLNDIGKRIYYKGFDYGEGGFVENHAPNTYMKFNSDGTFEMVPGKQDERLQEVDKFLNSYLRSLSPEDKQAALAMIGQMVEKGFNGADVNDILGILLEEDNVDHAAYLIAFLLEYKKENPELVDALNDVLTGMGLDNIAGIVDTVEEVTNGEYFDDALDLVAGLTDYIPDFVYEEIQEMLKEKGIYLSTEELQKIISIIQKASDDMDNIDSFDPGYDRGRKGFFEQLLDMVKNLWEQNYPGSGEFMIDVRKNRKMESVLFICSKNIKNYIERIEDICKNLAPGMEEIKETLTTIINNLEKQANDCERMSEVLNEIHTCYEITEKKIAAKS